jgi:putative membrane protein
MRERLDLIGFVPRERRNVEQQCIDSIQKAKFFGRTKIMERWTITITCLLAAFFASNCSPSANNTNVNMNRVGNTMGNAVNTVGNAANTVANTISNAAKSVTGGTDEDFMKNTAMAGTTEIEFSKLASTKATNAEIKMFAQMMITDHTKAATELKALAAKKNITLPADMDSSHKSELDSLKGKTGADFDKAYVDDMVSDHEKAVSDFQSKANNASDPDIKAFAAKTLPTLQKHLDAIKAIQAKMK